jgi:hypothetical protein
MSGNCLVRSDSFHRQNVCNVQRDYPRSGSFVRGVSLPLFEIRLYFLWNSSPVSMNIQGSSPGAQIAEFLDRTCNLSQYSETSIRGTALRGRTPISGRFSVRSDSFHTQRVRRLAKLSCKRKLTRVLFPPAYLTSTVQSCAQPH